MTSSVQPFSALRPGTPSAMQLGEAVAKRAVRSSKQDSMRKEVGEFVGNIFYGTLIRQMQASKFKTKYMDGGRGEEVFQGQMGMELAQRMGRSVSDPVSNKLYESIRHRLDREAAAVPAPGAVQKGGAL